MIIKAPGLLDWHHNRKSVFLAGSIEMGEAPNWQMQMELALDQLGVVVLNPRRDDWDSSWVQRASDERFREQVLWELDAMERASLVAVCFVGGLKAPITLLELGLNAARKKPMVVCCPDDFWRKGNVEILCERHGIQLVETLPALIGAVARKLQELEHADAKPARGANG